MRKTRTLPPDLIRKLFIYDPNIGSLKWNISKKGLRFGEEAGGLNVTSKHTSRTVCINGKKYQAHRIIWVWMTGQWPLCEVDHKDGDAINNRWKNLREATHSQNGKNLGIKKTNKTGVSGVGKGRRGKFRARIMVDKKDIYLGEFKTIAEAAAVRKAAAQKYFGEFARRQQ